MQRLFYASKIALIHLLGCAIVAALIYLFIFNFWFETPFSAFSRAKDIFLLILIVDLTLGPLVTLIIADPNKSKSEFSRDLSFVILVQLAALAYGVNTLVQVRPIWIAFERDHFRVVTLMDSHPQRIQEAPEGLQSHNWFGPKPIGVRVLSGDDPAFLESVQLSLQGRHPAFRPSSWVPYTEQKSQVLHAALPLDVLIDFHQIQSGIDIRPMLHRFRVEYSGLRFLPLSTDQPTNWTVLIDAETAAIVGYIPVSGWLD
jgi:hypothetical protein